MGAWVNDVSFTGNVVGDVQGNVVGDVDGHIRKTSGNLDISCTDISLNATNDIRLDADVIRIKPENNLVLSSNSGDVNINSNDADSKILLDQTTGNIEIDISQNLVMVPDNGIIDLSGNTCA